MRKPFVISEQFIEARKQKFNQWRDSLKSQKCKKCGQELPIEKFHKRKLRNGNWGYEKRCNDCADYNKSHPGYLKEYNKQNYKQKAKITKICVVCNKEYETHQSHSKYCSKECANPKHPKQPIYSKEELKEHARLYRVKWRKEHRIESNARRKLAKQRAFERNPELVRMNRNTYKHNRCASDINFRLAENLRKKVYLTLRKGKSLHTIDLLGCSIDYARKHIENQFKDGMTWDNWSMDGWHIDHIIPIALFDLTKEEDQICM